MGRRRRGGAAWKGAAQESGLTLVGPPRVTLGGLKGTVPVSVANHLRYPVLVKLQVGVPRNGIISVRSQSGYLKVAARTEIIDRKSTRLNSSHRCISYAVF